MSISPTRVKDIPTKDKTPKHLLHAFNGSINSTDQTEVMSAKVVLRPVIINVSFNEFITEPYTYRYVDVNAYMTCLLCYGLSPNSITMDVGRFLNVLKVVLITFSIIMQIHF